MVMFDTAEPKIRLPMIEPPSKMGAEKLVPVNQLESTVYLSGFPAPPLSTIVRGSAVEVQVTPPLKINTSPCAWVYCPLNPVIPGERCQGVDLDVPLLVSDPEAKSM